MLVFFTYLSFEMKKIEFPSELGVTEVTDKQTTVKERERKSKIVQEGGSLGEEGGQLNSS